MSKQYNALHDLVPFVQLKKRKKQPWSSVNFYPLTNDGDPC